MMIEPAVLVGFDLLGIAPLPGTAQLDRHIGELDRAVGRLRLLAQEGVHAYGQADLNRGPATDALHAYMTSPDGALPQAADLADRLTTAADGLRVSKGVIEWVVGPLSAVALAARVAVVFAPHLLPRLSAMGARFTAMLRDALSRVGRIFASLFKTSRVRAAGAGGRTARAGPKPDYRAVAANRSTPVDDVVAEELRRPGNRWRTENTPVYHGSRTSPTGSSRRVCIRTFPAIGSTRLSTVRSRDGTPGDASRIAFAPPAAAASPGVTARRRSRSPEGCTAVSSRARTTTGPATSSPTPISILARACGESLVRACGGKSG
ncbi:hypothetical protein ACFQYP_56040 [Nonomuraea antimicrobica]